MMLVVAALAEELETALEVCSRRRKTRIGGLPVWEGTRGDKRIHFMKVGAGPARSANALGRVLEGLDPTGILVTGYAGALDPALEAGDLIIAERAGLLDDSRKDAPLTEVQLAGSWALDGADELWELGRRRGLPVRRGTILTGPCIIGDPEQKRLLFERFRAAAIDMETAALARTAAAAAIPLRCVRAVSDEAGDDFLSSFLYDPAGRVISRATRVLTSGSLMRRYGQWRERSAAARNSLRRFLTCHFDSHP